MKVKFEIIDNSAVQFQGRHIDLHNNFDLIEIREFKNQVEIEIKKTEGDWVAQDELNGVLFLFKEVSYKYGEEGEHEPFSDNWKILGEISFFPSSLRDMNDGIIPQRLPNKEDDILFFFENGRLIRINCNEVQIKIK